MNKKDLTERDICSKFIGPAVRRAGWDGMMQIREEVAFTKGRIIVRGKLVSRGKSKRADYILYYKPNIPIAIIEAKDNNHRVGDGMQQALDYAMTLNIPFVFSSNGDGFVFHDRTGISPEKEASLTLDEFPSPADLWEKYRAWKGLTPDEEQIVLQDYFDDASGKAPRYYQCNAVNAAVEAIAKGQNRVLLVMATGTGKTYTAFQIIWRLWKAGRKKRILFLADRNVLVDQTMVNDFRPFGAAMAKLSTGAKTIEREDGSEVALPTALDRKRRIDTAYEVYLGLYQAITGPEERQKLFREFSPGFFDLIVIDECHRGSAAEDSAWREILEYFSAATQIGLTATPKETEYVSNIHYFGKPVYSYSLKQGNRKGRYPTVQFDFLGYTFRPRFTAWPNGTYGVSFLPAASQEALKAMRREVRQWGLQNRTDMALNDLARLVNPYLRGWINYYSHFYKSAMHNSLRRVDFHLRKWVRRKFKRFKQKPKSAREWLAHVIRTSPALFAHWPLLYAGQPDTGSRMSREVHVRI